jgi:hypothetical protein
MCAAFAYTLDQFLWDRALWQFCPMSAMLFGQQLYFLFIRALYR